MKRRSFIKLTSGLSMGLMVPSVLASELMTTKTNEYIENLVIGSGYGGAVAALRLTQAGKKVVMLEMGLDWEKEGGKYKPFSNLITPKNNSTWLRKSTQAPMMNISRFNKKFTGVLDRMDFENVKVYAGRGVGGGSLVNGGMAVQPKKQYFKEIFPDLDVEEFWKTYFPLAQKELDVNQISDKYYNDTPYYKFARVGESEARKAGFKTIRVPNVYSFDYMKKEEAGKVPKSALAKEVIYGNNHGKQSLEKTYLKKALTTGLLSIHDLHQVDYFQQTEKGYAVYVNVLNTEGEVVEKKTINCKKLFLNAGSLGTTKLLLASKFKGKMNNFDPSLGEYWGNNGNVMTGRNMVNTLFNRVENEATDSNFRPGTGVKQSTIPVSGIDNWEDEKHSFFAEISPLPMGMEVYTALYLIINKVPTPGSISYNPKINDIIVNWEKKNYKHTVKNAKYFIKKMNKANGGTPSGLLWKGGYGPDICYHPLGGAVLGKTTDLYGRVKGYENLYITDGALVPASIGVNPFLTITAVAEYCMDEIIKSDYQQCN
ncbi:GMC oxidoreductase [Aequorivita xiaoshiensis]|uniref:Cholesterol oxidase n=1 Tax=Aequorivita xiaoshiensis TaxID=2874476 RepID=A0A9X1R2L4_9FLAO|nr:GMC oxidoreductase [Aequorivita xiaoshiensis]MCG2430418.1 GMC family oxidoreductase N-terminal domain-containing protein [Aequorivita xiaoshiensis]